jgi:hypothetical protein
MTNHWSNVATVSYEAVSIIDRAIAQEDVVGLLADTHLPAYRQNKVDIDEPTYTRWLWSHIFRMPFTSMIV